MERQNDAQIDELHDRISQLKEITKGIGKEVSESVSFLDSMGIDFDKASKQLRSTVSHLKLMVEQRGGKNLCCTVLLVLVVFFVMYVLSSASSPSGAGALRGTGSLTQNATAAGGSGR
ncbi:unnamed protein product [Prorocentrum cordatum]|uniref:t-SNARE coiled-coil homology domain-containing protein n=1 Tax=Prorocentrum cordatum TaxID=2364126 RepID=A0ABN9U3U5_9DINO|nr:unnamed protein product [Polarella glacialis]